MIETVRMEVTRYWSLFFNNDQIPSRKVSNQGNGQPCYWDEERQTHAAVELKLGD